MVIFMDFGLFLLLVIFGAGMLAGGAMSVTQWILHNMPTVILILFLKAIFFTSSMGLFRKGLKFKERAFCVIATGVDMLRSGIVLWATTDAIVTAFSGGIFHLLVTGLGIVIGVPLFVVASYGPLFIDGDVSFVGEVLSLIAVGLCCLLIYGFFGGW